MNINGVVNNLNQFTLNGAPISQQTSTARGGRFLSPNVEGVKEFKVQTSTYDATVGRSGGGTINAVMEIGTNPYPGTVFGYWRNSVLDASHWQSGQVEIPKGFHNQHQFRGTVGGPVKMGKTFFFFSEESWRERLPIPVNNTTVPTGIKTNPDGSVDLSEFPAGRNITGGINNPFSCATSNSDGTCATRNPLPGNVIPADLVSPIGRKILGLSPQPNPPGFTNNLVATTRGIISTISPTLRSITTFRTRPNFMACIPDGPAQSSPITPASKILISSPATSITSDRSTSSPSVRSFC